MRKNILKKVSWLNCLIAFNVDEMFDTIKDINLFGFIIKTLDPKFPPVVRANGVLAISLLSYHKSLFNLILDNNVIEIILKITMDPNTEETIKLYATQALVHYALNKDSIDILIEKGVMSIFSACDWSADEPMDKVNLSSS